MPLASNSNLSRLPNLSSGIGPAHYRVLGVLLLFLSVFFAIVISVYGMLAFVVGLVCILALPVAYVIITYPRIGILVLLTGAYIIMFFSRLISVFPIGTIMDCVEVLLIIGFFLKQRGERNWGILKTPATFIILVWVLYNLLQLINPAGSTSTLSWLYTVRSVTLVATTYFIFLYHIRDVAFVRTIIKLWLFLSLIAALYAFQQEHMGFTGFEQAWLSSDDTYTRLYYIGNHWRKFSIFTDPVAFAYNMMASALLCIGLLTGGMTYRKKYLLGAAACFFLLNMLYSGTRGAYVLVPFAFLIIGILKFNRRILIAGTVLAIITTALIFVPTSNYNIYRFQTAFKPSGDASFNIRKTNQKKIQPYIQTHPFGGGLGSTGIWGQRFTPQSALAKFPPDSGYVRVAVELGWVGLFIFCTFMFLVLKAGIRSYFQIKDPELKSYCMAMLIILFALNLGNYPQEALVQYPLNIYFYLAIALIHVCLKLDKEKRLNMEAVKPDFVH